MEVVGKGILDDYATRHADARDPLARWIAVVEAAEWSDPMGLRQTFGSADPGVKVDSGVNMTVFNIGGNNHRLIALVDYEDSEVIVKAVMPHAEYDKDKWKRTM